MRIKIGDEFLDVFQNEIVAQTFAVNEIGDITSRQGGFSNNFTVPLSTKNKELLGFPDDINTSSNKAYEKVDATLFDNGVVIGVGYLRYQIVTNSDRIELSFFSDNVEWFTLLKDKSLKDLDLSEFDHEWTAANITTAISEDKSSGYTYPLIDYGEFTDLTALSVDSGQMYPAVFISTIVSRIFFEIGWKVDGEMIDHPLYKRMVIPFSDKSFSHDSSYVEDNTFERIKPNTQSATVPAASGLVEVAMTWVLPSTSILPIAEPGVYNVRLVADVSFVTTIQSSAANFVIKQDNIILVNSSTYDDYVGDVIIDTDLELEAGDIEVFLNVFTPAGDDLTYSVFLNTTSITVTPKENILPGSTIQLASTLPDIKQSDLLNYMAFCFGAVPQSNNLSKTVSFGLFKSIKNNISNALDWSDKIDLSKNSSVDFTELLENYSAVSILKYADDDNDAELSAYEAETTKTFGEGQIDITNEHVTGRDTIYEAPFSPMININSFDNTMYIPQIAFKVEGGDDQEPEPKIAILSENISVSTLSLGVYSQLNVTDSVDQYTTLSESSIPFCWFAKTEYIPEIDALLDSLAFDQILFPNAIGDPLIDRFLEDYEDILNEMKYLKQFIHLNEVDINALDFTVPFYLEQFKSYFYISRINNYEGSFRTSEVEAVKIT